MASNGTISHKWKGYTYQIAWTATQNTSGNYSTLTCNHSLICDPSWDLDIGARVISCTVNSTTKTCTSPSIYTSGNSTIFLGTTSYTINHSSDGSASFSLSSVFPIRATIQGVYQEDIPASGSGILNSMPRSSTMTVPDFIMGTEGTMNITKASSSFTHTISYKFGTKSGNIVVKTQNTSVKWTPSLNDFADQVPNDVKGTGTLTLITYSGDTEVGRNVYSFNCSVPDSVVPSIRSVMLLTSAIDGQGDRILVQGKNRLTIRTDSEMPGQGATIVSYTYTGPSLSKTTNFSTYTLNTVQNSGTLTFTVTVTDSRGRTATKQSSPIVCYEYAPPSFSRFEVHRDNNKNVKCTYEVDCADVNGTNSISVQFYYKKGSGDWIAGGTSTSLSQTDYTVFSNADDANYSVYAVATDAYGGTTNSSSKTTFGSEKLLNIAKYGNGIAIGRKSTVTSASAAGKFEVAWNTTFDNDVNVTGDLKINNKNLIDIFYPVGSIFMSTNNINPQSFMGGSWSSFGDSASMGAYMWKRTS